MKNLSVIIPTILAKPKVLNKLLTIFEKDAVVDEIILINNAQEEFIPTAEIKKLKIYNQEKNLYVNASWNLGVELSKNDYFLIINDDILCPYNFCSIVMNSGIFDKDDTGLIGLYYWEINDLNREEYEDIDIPILKKDEPIFFIPFNYYMGTGNWASAFFGHKKNYYQIPDKIKIIFGDNYLLKQNLDNGKKNYFIKNIICNHISSSSSSKKGISCVCFKDFDFANEYFGADNLCQIHRPPSDIPNEQTLVVSFTD